MTWLLLVVLLLCLFVCCLISFDYSNTIFFNIFLLYFLHVFSDASWLDFQLDSNLLVDSVYINRRMSITLYYQSLPPPNFDIFSHSFPQKKSNNKKKTIWTTVEWSAPIISTHTPIQMKPIQANKSSFTMGHDHFSITDELAREKNQWNDKNLIQFGVFRGFDFIVFKWAKLHTDFKVVVVPSFIIECLPAIFITVTLNYTILCISTSRGLLGNSNLFNAADWSIFMSAAG